MADSYGVIVEGDYDAAVFPELIRKIVSSFVDVEVRTCRGWSGLMKHFPGLLRDLEHVRQGRPVDKALVIRDWRGPDEAPCEEKMLRKIEGRRFSFPRGVHLCCVRQEMETWLLADDKAINEVAARRGGRMASPVRGQLEKIGNPKERLMRVLSEAGLPYDQEVCREVANRIGLEVLRNRCPSFRSFEKRVIDC